MKGELAVFLTGLGNVSLLESILKGRLIWISITILKTPSPK
jgi:hypothetical protein